MYNLILLSEVICRYVHRTGQHCVELSIRLNVLSTF